MAKALGMIEYKTVSMGMLATDQLLKAADIELIEAQTVCPGKFIALFKGDLSAVKAAAESATVTYGTHLIDTFVLGNPHESIFPAIYGAAQVECTRALGVLETFSSSAIIVAADVAAKTADVWLVEIRIARGMCGKSYLLLSGEVAAVQAAIDRAKASVGENGMLLDSAVIPNPDPQLWKNIL